MAGLCVFSFLERENIRIPHAFFAQVRPCQYREPKKDVDLNTIGIMNRVTSKYVDEITVDRRSPLISIQSTMLFDFASSCSFQFPPNCNLFGKTAYSSVYFHKLSIFRGALYDLFTHVKLIDCR